MIHARVPDGRYRRNHAGETSVWTFMKLFPAHRRGPRFMSRGYPVTVSTAPSEVSCRFNDPSAALGDHSIPIQAAAISPKTMVPKCHGYHQKMFENRFGSGLSGSYRRVRWAQICGGWPGCKCRRRVTQAFSGWSLLRTLTLCVNPSCWTSRTCRRQPVSAGGVHAEDSPENDGNYRSFRHRQAAEDQVGALVTIIVWK